MFLRQSRRGFLAALSIWLTVSPRAFFASAASPLLMALRSFFTWDFSWDRFFRLRSLRFRPCLICFNADA